MNSISGTASSLIQVPAELMNLISLRRAIHANPESGFEEFETSALIEQQLKLLGYSVRNGIAKTGLIADFKTNGPLIAIRSDMDALAVHELNNVAFRSRKAGLMHACGHDAHVACVVGAAQILAQAPVTGSTRIIVQPAEHDADTTETGSALMIRGGALNHVEAILGLHVDATMPAGKVGIVVQPTSDMRSSFSIVSTGLHMKDNVQAGTKIMIKLQELGTEAALHQCKIQVSQMRMSDVDHNIGTAIHGTISYQSVSAALTIIKHLKDYCDHHFGESSFNINAKLDEDVFAQHERAIESTYAAAAALLGEANVVRIKRKTWTKQFADYTEHVPGAFMLLGTEIRGSRRTMHSASFDIDEASLPIGAAVLAAAATALSEEFSK